MRNTFLLICLAVLCGCTSMHRQARSVNISLPAWFTSPGPGDFDCIPVNLNMRLPDHFRPFAKKHDLPEWVVYGVVRCLGAQEFTVNGTYRSFTSIENNTEANVIVDDLYYDVTIEGIDRQLHNIAEECSAVTNELERLDVLGRHIKYRSGAYALFSLAPNTDENFRNLLKESGADDSPAETFAPGTGSSLPQVGWQETETHFINTIIGEFQYSDAIGSFRKTEEDAIHDMARNIVMKYSHMQKRLTIAENTIKDSAEEAYKEELLLKISGLNIVRRAVDIDIGASIVTISVPKNGIHKVNKTSQQ